MRERERFISVMLYRHFSGKRNVRQKFTVNKIYVATTTLATKIYATKFAI